MRIPAKPSMMWTIPVEAAHHRYTARYSLAGSCPGTGDDVKHLGKKLSLNVEVYFPGSEEFLEVSKRVAGPGRTQNQRCCSSPMESDVTKTVKIAIDALSL